VKSGGKRGFGGLGWVKNKQKMGERLAGGGWGGVWRKQWILSNFFWVEQKHYAPWAPSRLRKQPFFKIFRRRIRPSASYLIGRISKAVSAGSGILDGFQQPKNGGIFNAADGQSAAD